MPITFECEGCGQSYTVGDNFAGKGGKCQQCGHKMTVPDRSQPASDRRGLGPVVLEPMPRPTRKNAPSAGRVVAQVLLTVLVVIALAAAGFSIFRFTREDADNPDGPRAAPIGQGLAEHEAMLATARSGPIRLPRFPDLGPSREIELGITFQEINLGPPRPNYPPGWSGKLWLYLPAGDHPDHSLPCVLITGAGSTLIAGMELADGDQAEHLPYARAGYAVLAFELDGMVINRNDPSEPEIQAAMERFLMARAGLVNAHVALEFLLAKVPQVDPKRLIAAGHSSAGTLALLFAENDRRISRCIAYAPVTQLEQHFRSVNPEGSIEMVRRAGCIDLINYYSPDVREMNLDRPLFLFNSQQDEMGYQTREMAARLRASGKPVTLLTVPTGDHYNSMIERGIPAGIEWLKEQDAKR